jgi:chloramphenicol O-acetyltransferase type A
MKVIDIENWKGKEHYLWFKDYAHPYYGITSKIKLTKFRKYQKENNLPFYISFIYTVVSALNECEEFKLRIEGENVLLFEAIHPAFTVMTDQGLYSNCFVKYEPFDKFLETANLAIEEAKLGIPHGPELQKEVHPLALYFLTSLPWLDFTSVSHPMTADPTDSIPRIAWGKFYEEAKDMVMSLSIQVNHALVDGYPLSLAFIKIQEYLDQPEMILI